jgi:hypothetical protein
VHGQGTLLSRAPDVPGKLHVVRKLGITRPRCCVRVNNVSPDIVVVPFNNDITTLERAVKERVFFVKNDGGQFVSPPRPSTEVFLNRMEPVKAILIPFLPVTAPWNHERTVASFKGCKRRRYQNALNSMAEKPMKIEEEAKVEVFVKYEKTDRTSKLDPVPRVISPRSSRFNLRLARYLRPIEESVFDSLGELFGHKTVFKGMDTDEVAMKLREKWEMFTSPVAVGLDASRFDQHVSKVALEFEHSVYANCFVGKHRRKLVKLLKHQLVNKCYGEVADGTLKYTIEGTRMSGDMNTSLGNCVIMCMMIRAYLTQAKVNGQLANNGDDCVVIMEKRDLAKFQIGLREWFLEMGFNMTVETPCYEFEHIEFCQTRPVMVDSGWTMCRNPWTAIAKDSVLLKNPEVYQKLIPVWMKAVGEGGLSIAGDLPIFRSFYSLYSRSGTESYLNRRDKRVSMTSLEIMPWFMRQCDVKGSRKLKPILSETRCSFWEAWGVTPDEQVALENYYDSIPQLSSNLEPLRGFEPRDVFTDQF